MPRVSAGLLMYRIHDGKLQMLLAHPGGPFFKNKDDGVGTVEANRIWSAEQSQSVAARPYPISTFVNSTKHGSSKCIEPVTVLF
jgi:predicted NUDIX family NTP pyrophosphohydrolase